MYVFLHKRHFLLDYATLSFLHHTLTYIYCLSTTTDGNKDFCKPQLFVMIRKDASISNVCKKVLFNTK